MPNMAESHVAAGEPDVKGDVSRFSVSVYCTEHAAMGAYADPGFSSAYCVLEAPAKFVVHTRPVEYGTPPMTTTNRPTTLLMLPTLPASAPSM